jgi:hypothetical protein
VLTDHQCPENKASTYTTSITFSLFSYHGIKLSGNNSADIDDLNVKTTSIQQTICLLGHSISDFLFEELLPQTPFYGKINTQPDCRGAIASERRSRFQSSVTQIMQLRDGICVPGVKMLKIT